MLHLNSDIFSLTESLFQFICSGLTSPCHSMRKYFDVMCLLHGGGEGRERKRGSLLQPHVSVMSSSSGSV